MPDDVPGCAGGAPEPIVFNDDNPRKWWLTAPAVLAALAGFTVWFFIRTGGVEYGGELHPWVIYLGIVWLIALPACSLVFWVPCISGTISGPTTTMRERWLWKTRDATYATADVRVVVGTYGSEASDGELKSVEQLSGRDPRTYHCALSLPNRRHVVMARGSHSDMDDERSRLLIMLGRLPKVREDPSRLPPHLAALDPNRQPPSR